jgi:guanylate kinase
MEIGNLFIISAPSGTGKTTILKKVISEMENIMFSVSHTTRTPRPGEKEGVDYYFVEKDAFQKMLEKELFYEWAEVHGNLYGTSRYAVQETIDQGKDIILDIDVQGGFQAREKVGARGIFIFIMPPSIQELESRLVKRGTEPESVIATRLKNAQVEIKFMDQYDYVIVNDNVSKAVEVLKSIIIAERSRKKRSISGEPLSIDF